MSHTEFLVYKDFAPSVARLKQKGGSYQRAGDTALKVLGLVHSSPDITVEEVFRGIALTNHGENRIPHCRKYDLTGFARLVTAYTNNTCILLFAGDHDATDKWLDTNNGLDFVAYDVKGRQQVAPVYISELGPGKRGAISSTTDWMQSAPLLDVLKTADRDSLLNGIEAETAQILRQIHAYTDEDEIMAAVSRVPASDHQEAILDVLLSLRGGNHAVAANRVDLFLKRAKTIAELSSDELSTVVSGDQLVRVQDVDPVLFEHFVRTANFRDWMLYLHPAQREIVSRDFLGPTRLAGVSGSGKTAVVIHRALRIARENPQAQVLVLTLNHALAQLILELVNESSHPESKLSNLKITSVFALCVEKLHLLEPEKKDHYGIKTVVPNRFVDAEHIDDIWEEYFQCSANNLDADVLFEVIRTLVARGVFAQDYLRQELNYIRSALSSDERDQYLSMERTGRAFPLDRRYRAMVLEGLYGWERKMGAVGAIDDLGVVDALYRHIGSLQAEYDHVLVDEVQDLGTLELKIIRALTKHGSNDLFLAGDAVQAVHTKYCDLKKAGIELPSARWIKLTQNYRNSRQILAAAYSVLEGNKPDADIGIADFEVLIPEYANFSSAKPLLLSAESLQQELALGLGYLQQFREASLGQKTCISICGFSQKMVEELGAELGLEVLSDATSFSTSTLLLSDLEQTKGFEFDVMIILNCSAGIVPNPQLPEREAFREMSKLYVAMTRAKKELIVSFSGSPSKFLDGCGDLFSAGQWTEHEVKPATLGDVKWPSVTNTYQNLGDLDVSGHDFLRLRQAVGLSHAAQEAILKVVTGRSLSRKEAGRRKEVEWRDLFGFYSTLHADPRARINVISNEAWSEISAQLGAPHVDLPDAGEMRHSATPAPATQNHEAYRQGTFTLYRHTGVKTYAADTLQAYFVAAVLVAQKKTRLEDLEVGQPMRRDILEFLLPFRVLKSWATRGGLRTKRNDTSLYLLTKVGWDDCLVARVAAKRIEAFRETIVKGPDRKDYARFERRVFASAPTDDAGAA